MKKLLLCLTLVSLLIVSSAFVARLYLWHASSPLKSAPLLDGYADYVWRAWVQSGQMPPQLWRDERQNTNGSPISYELLDPVRGRFRLRSEFEDGRRLEIDYQLSATGVVRQSLRTVDTTKSAR